MGQAGHFLQQMGAKRETDYTRRSGVRKEPYVFLHDLYCIVSFLQQKSSEVVQN
jgi:hypothetical protein